MRVDILTGYPVCIIQRFLDICSKTDCYQRSFLTTALPSTMSFEYTWMRFHTLLRLFNYRQHFEEKIFRHITSGHWQTQWRPAEEKLLIAEARFISVMGLRKFWNNYKVLIVMGTSLGLIHWGWYNLKSNPVLHKNREEYIPEPGIVAFVSPPAAAAPPPAKSK